MLSSFNNLFEQKPPHKGSPRIRVSLPASVPPKKDPPERRQTFAKVFRWHLPDGQTEAPASVEIVGSFTHWQKVSLERASEFDGWQVTIPHIPGNRTHHYMLLVDGKPVHDENADGMAIPHGPQEEQYPLKTPRGGRVFMLYAQAK